MIHATKAFFICADPRVREKMEKYLVEKYGKDIFIFPDLGGIKQYVDFPGNLADHWRIKALYDMGIRDFGGGNHGNCAMYETEHWKNNPMMKEEEYHLLQLLTFAAKVQEAYSDVKVVGLHYGVMNDKLDGVVEIHDYKFAPK